MLAFMLLAMIPGADDRVFPLAEKVEGKTGAEWSAEWWRWAVAIKKPRNPVADATGEFAAEGQAGPVFFLAGTTGGTAKRKVTIPKGKPIFFPILNVIENEVADKANDKKLIAGAKKFADDFKDMEATLDGKSLGTMTGFRVASKPFDIVAPEKKEEALFDDILGKQRGASDGYWIMLKPLKPGKHALRFTGVHAPKEGKGFKLDVSYELTVEK